MYVHYLISYKRLIEVHSTMHLLDLNDYDVSMTLQADEQGVCAFLAYFIMAGYQFRQAQAVLDKLVRYLQWEFQKVWVCGQQGALSML